MSTASSGGFEGQEHHQTSPPLQSWSCWQVQLPRAKLGRARTTRNHSVKVPLPELCLHIWGECGFMWLTPQAHTPHTLLLGAGGECSELLQGHTKGSWHSPVCPRGHMSLCQGRGVGKATLHLSAPMVAGKQSLDAGGHRGMCVPGGAHGGVGARGVSSSFAHTSARQLGQPLGEASRGKGVCLEESEGGQGGR